MILDLDPIWNIPTLLTLWALACGYFAYRWGLVMPDAPKWVDPGDMPPIKPWWRKDLLNQADYNKLYQNLLSQSGSPQVTCGLANVAQFYGTPPQQPPWGELQRAQQQQAENAAEQAAIRQFMNQPAVVWPS